MSNTEPAAVAPKTAPGPNGWPLLRSIPGCGANDITSSNGLAAGLEI